MNFSTEELECDIAIIGGGYSTLLFLVEALRNG